MRPYLVELSVQGGEQAEADDGEARSDEEEDREAVENFLLRNSRI